MTRLRWLVIVCVALASCRMSEPLPNPPAGSYRAESFQVSTGGAAETVQGAAVSDAFFSGGKLRPALGRATLPQENGSMQVAVLSYSFWERKFHADPGVIGKTLQVNGHDAVIVGIMPRGFAFPPGTELWVPK
jgi:putative ABC transport system permease protein